MELKPSHITEPRSHLRAGTTLDGASLQPLKKHKDPRGSFTEIFQKSWNTCIEPVQWSFVESSADSLRGLHLHRRHDEYFCCVSGHCLVALLDLRPMLSENAAAPEISDLPWSLYELHGDDPATLTFPVDIVHGWYFFSASTHIQAVSESYLDYSKDDNHGVHWNDSDLPFEWPFDNCNLSESASNFGSLRSLITKLKSA